jgi:hypothetical protein
VLFRFIATIEELRESTPQFQTKTITTGRQEVARFDGDQEIVLYHDNSAGDRNLSFVATLDEDEDSQSRTDRVQRVAKGVAGNYFKKDYQDHTGQPDVIVLEIISEDGDHEYLIVEVKNSANEDTRFDVGSRRHSSISPSCVSTRSTSSDAMMMTKSTSALGGTDCSWFRISKERRRRSRSKQIARSRSCRLPNSRIS